MQLQSNSCSPPGKGSYIRRGNGTHRQQWKWKMWYFAAFYMERKPVSILLGRSAFQENQSFYHQTGNTNVKQGCAFI